MASLSLLVVFYFHHPERSFVPPTDVTTGGTANSLFLIFSSLLFMSYPAFQAASNLDSRADNVGSVHLFAFGFATCLLFLIMDLLLRIASEE